MDTFDWTGFDVDKEESGLLFDSTYDTDLSKLLQTANKQRFGGAALKTFAAAGDAFNSILEYSMGRKTASMKADVTKGQLENQMAALDNQVLYYKNQITDKFAQLMARNTVTMAAKGLRVSAGALLEQTKDAAYDATQDIRMAESNVELKKIALRSQQRQADIEKKLQKNLLTANMIKGMADLGLTIATGGGTFESFGNLYANAYGSLNSTVYGG